MSSSSPMMTIQSMYYDDYSSVASQQYLGQDLLDGPNAYSTEVFGYGFHLPRYYKDVSGSPPRSLFADCSNSRPQYQGWYSCDSPYQDYVQLSRSVVYLPRYYKDDGEPFSRSFKQKLNHNKGVLLSISIQLS